MLVLVLAIPLLLLEVKRMSPFRLELARNLWQLVMADILSEVGSGKSLINTYIVVNVHNVLDLDVKHYFALCQCGHVARVQPLYDRIRQLVSSFTLYIIPLRQREWCSCDRFYDFLIPSIDGSFFSSSSALSICFRIKPRVASRALSSCRSRCNGISL